MPISPMQTYSSFENNFTNNNLENLKESHEFIKKPPISEGIRVSRMAEKIQKLMSKENSVSIMKITGLTEKEGYLEKVLCGKFYIAKYKKYYCILKDGNFICYNIKKPTVELALMSKKFEYFIKFLILKRNSKISCVIDFSKLNAKLFLSQKDLTFTILFENLQDTSFTFRAPNIKLYEEWVDTLSLEININSHLSKISIYQPYNFKVFFTNLITQSIS